MKEICVLIFLFTIVLGIAFSNARCPVNEVEVECINFCNTCEQREVCVRVCIPGCDCRPGYLRNQLGFCIPRRFCRGPPTHEVADDHGLPHNPKECRDWCHGRGYNNWRWNGVNCHCW